MSFILIISLYRCCTVVAQTSPVFYPPVVPSRKAQITYQLPTTGPLPSTYRVTLAITDPDNRDWIVSQFAAGVVRTVTVENQGKFTETWNGLDDNFMPLPPGTYGVKGIYMPAKIWSIDGKYHTLIPHWNGGADSWMPSLQQEDKPVKIIGDPVSRSWTDVDVGPNGKASIQHTYLENAFNPYMVDLNKPIDYDQVVKQYNSWGPAGGPATATDGTEIWSAGSNKINFIYRGDNKPFGNDLLYTVKIFKLPSKATALAAVKATATTILYASYADSILVFDGYSATAVKKAGFSINQPKALAAYNDSMYVLYSGNQVSRIRMDDGIPSGSWQPVFTISGVTNPTDMVIDSRGGMYVSDQVENQVYKLNAAGGVAKAFGSASAQQPGKYDPLVFMSPAKMAAWRDEAGNDRLIVVEMRGPCRISEWSSDGSLLREWLTSQFTSNFGWDVDPDDGYAYLIGAEGINNGSPGENSVLTRFKIDYATGKWSVDAVWDSIYAEYVDGKGQISHKYYPRICRVNGRKYIAFGDGFMIYRFDGDKLVRSAGIVFHSKVAYFWHDINNDGQVQTSEYLNSPASIPPGFNTYWGENFTRDLGFLMVGFNTKSCWRIAPGSFDENGNPVFDNSQWQKIFTDPIFESRASKTADALHGGNELDEKYSSDWSKVTGSPTEGYWVVARGGYKFTANRSAQDKISYYTPDGRIKWRTGREALSGNAVDGQIVASLWITEPVNGLLGVTDNSRAGYAVYTADEGLFVENIFLGGQSQMKNTYGHPGEFFAGFHFLNKTNGKVYICMGKTSPLLYQVEGWTATTNSVNKLTVINPIITITENQISTPPQEAIDLRPGWTGPVLPKKVMRFTRGTPLLDGSITGWENAAIHSFGVDERTVEVRCMYQPDTLFVRWHARIGWTFTARTLQPVERIFTHDRGADVLSLYFQGDVNASGTIEGGRPGDVRIDAGIFDDNGTLRTAAIGLYPKWYGPGQANPYTYGSPISTQNFESVIELQSVIIKHLIDPDGKGFVITMAIPRSVIPLISSFDPTIQTRANFSALLSGSIKFWWANITLGNTETSDEPSESRLYPECWTGTEFFMK